MATFNAASFLRTRSPSPRTVVTHPDGTKTSLAGIPKATTVDGLASLSVDADGVRVSLPAEVTRTATGTHKVRRGGPLDGKDGAEFIRSMCGKSVAVADEPAAA